MVDFRGGVRPVGDLREMERREAVHVHVCPRCDVEWEHESRQCGEERERVCEECGAEEW
jgi:hypothetical protein